MVAGVKVPGLGVGFCLLSDFREQSFCGPCGPCFFANIDKISSVVSKKCSRIIKHLNQNKQYPQISVLAKQKNHHTP